MVTTTTTYSLKKPTVGDDEDLWGGYLNDSMDLIDDVLDGTTPVTGIDINSGTIDNAVIGGTTPVAGTFTALTANTSLGVTGNITVSGTVDGVDIATRDGVLTTTTTTANAALPKAGGTMTGAITFAAGQTFDGRDVSADGTKLDGIESGATADQTKSDIDALGIAASTAATLATARNIALTGAVTGNVNFDGSGNVSIATTATADPTLTLSGDASGSATFTNLGNATLSVTVADDSHNHVISNIDGLQTALDAKLASSSYTASDVLTKIKTVDGSGSGLDADLLDGYNWDSSGKTVRAQNFYADDWFRNYNSGEGLYNEATGTHFMSRGTGQWTIMDADSSIRLNLETNSSSFRGAINADSNNDIGFLDAGTAWGYRHRYNQSHHWNIANVQFMELNNDGLFLADGSLREDYDALSGTSPTCNVNSGGAFSLSMSGNTTFTFSSPRHKMSKMPISKGI